MYGSVQSRCKTVFLYNQKQRELQNEKQNSDFQYSFGEKWFKSFKKVGSKLIMIIETQS